MNYTYLYKKEIANPDDLPSLGKYDYFLTSFAQSERVLTPADKIDAKEIVWFVDKAEAGNLFLAGKRQLQLDTNYDWMTIKNFIMGIHPVGKRICIDSTGFTIPYLIFTIRTLYYAGVRKLDIIYTEPKKYDKEEKTSFSEDPLGVSQIVGLAGKHTSDTESDILIIATGYDYSRIIEVASHKKPLQKVLLFGFPSMSAEMFQENIISSYKAQEDLNTDCFHSMEGNLYAPANDPFVTAQVIKEFIESHKSRTTNFYLAPVSSKPQALGIALFYINENCWNKNISILYPYCVKYHLNNTEGIARIWRYSFEFE